MLYEGMVTCGSLCYHGNVNNFRDPSMTLFSVLGQEYKTLETSCLGL